MNDIDNLFKTHILNLDKDIIYLISLRIKYKTNYSIYKHPIFTNTNIYPLNNTNMSLLDLFSNVNV